jgi:hypothetical protein
MKNPCKDCITYAMCRNQINEHLECKDWDNNAGLVIVSYMQTIEKKCKKLTKYIIYRREIEDVPLTSLIYQIIYETFNKPL